MLYIYRTLRKTVWILAILCVLLAFTSGCNSSKKKDLSPPVLDVPTNNEMAVKAAQDQDARYEELLKKILEKDNATKEKDVEEYRLRIGDRLEVSLLEEPEMTRDLTVIPDGSITYLLVGEVSAAGKTVKELRLELTESLSKYFVEPKVSVILMEVAVREEDINKVSVFGACSRPGEYDVLKGDRIINIMAKAGGLLYINDWMGGRTVANLKASYISRNGVKLDVDFDRLLRLGDMDYNIPVQPNDFIYIADAENSAIYILGQVENPQLIPYNRDITLIEAISRCGGFTFQAEKSRVVVLRNSTTESEFFFVDTESLLYGNKDEKNIVLQEGDIVWVPEQGLSEYSRYAQYLMTFGDMVLQAYGIRREVMFPPLSRKDVYGK